jgi:flagellar biosynthesis protein FliQ
MSVYIILSVCVIVVYSLITVLLVGLVITICYKQRQINELKNTISQFTHKHENSLRQ